MVPSALSLRSHQSGEGLAPGRDERGDVEEVGLPVRVGVDTSVCVATVKRRGNDRVGGCGWGGRGHVCEGGAGSRWEGVGIASSRWRPHLQTQDSTEEVWVLI